MWRDDLSEHDRQKRIAEASSEPALCRAVETSFGGPRNATRPNCLRRSGLDVNRHLGTNARSLPELVEQLGVARFGHRPKVADTFCGGGSIPFEAARVGCDVYASDLNPIACLLTWGLSTSLARRRQKRDEIEAAQQRDCGRSRRRDYPARHRARRRGQPREGLSLLPGNALPARPAGWCRWLQPGSISRTRKVVAKLSADLRQLRRYDIEIHSGVSDAEMAEAEMGTVRDGRVVHPMNPERSGVEIKRSEAIFVTRLAQYWNRLRLWEKSDFVSAP